MGGVDDLLVTQYSLCHVHLTHHPVLAGEWKLEEPKENALKGDFGIVLKVCVAPLLLLIDFLIKTL